MTNETTGYTLRRAGAEDIDTLTRLRMAMMSELTMPGAEGAPGPPEEAIKEYFQATVPVGEFVAFLADAGENVVGCGGMVLFRKPPQKGNLAEMEGYILNMYTEPAWRGRGIARTILDRLMEAAREAGAGTVWLRASEMGAPVYEKAGFAGNPTYMQRSVRAGGSG